MKRSILFILICIVLLTSFVCAESFNGRVMSVIDGNNIVILSDSDALRVRFIAMECPELDQPFGLQAKQYVADLVLGKEVWVDVKGQDHDNRLLCTVIVEGREVAKEVIKAGLAWYEPRLIYLPQLAEVQKEAKSKKIGLWAYSGSKHPRFFRQETRSITPIMSNNPCHIGASSYGFIEASNPSDYRKLEFIASPGDCYSNYYFPYYYDYGYRPPMNIGIKPPVVSHPKSVNDPNYIKNQHSVTDTSCMRSQRSVIINSK